MGKNGSKSNKREYELEITKAGIFFHVEVMLCYACVLKFCKLYFSFDKDFLLPFFLL
jgi:hypothetical protein